MFSPHLSLSKTHKVSAQDLFAMKNILQKMKIITNSVFALIPFLNNLLKTSFGQKVAGDHVGPPCVSGPE